MLTWMNTLTSPLISGQWEHTATFKNKTEIIEGILNHHLILGLLKAKFIICMYSFFFFFLIFDGPQITHPDSSDQVHRSRINVWLLQIAVAVMRSGGVGEALQYQMDMGVRLTFPKAGAFGENIISKKWGVIGWEAKFKFKIRGHWVRMLLLIFQLVL